MEKLVLHSFRPIIAINFCFYSYDSLLSRFATTERIHSTSDMPIQYSHYQWYNADTIRYFYADLEWLTEFMVFTSTIKLASYIHLLLLTPLAHIVQYAHIHLEVRYGVYYTSAKHLKYIFFILAPPILALSK